MWTGLCAAALCGLAAGPALASPFKIPSMDAAAEFEVKIEGEATVSELETEIETALDVTFPIIKGLETSVTLGRGSLKEGSDPAHEGWLDTEWAVALTGDPPAVQAAAGALPEEGWLVAFLAGARFMPSTEPAPGDVAWATCGDLMIAVGRSRWSLRTSERAHVKQLVRIANSLART